MDFVKSSPQEYEENHVGYDPNSLMHYGEDAFTKNGAKTITFKVSLLIQISLRARGAYLSMIRVLQARK